MKIIKYAGIIVVLLIVLIGALNIIQSPTVIESSKSITAPQQKVFSVLTSYDKFPAWSPFLVSDPNQKNWVTGKDGVVGSRFHWQGVDEESEGFQELVELKTPSLLVMNCTITVPFESNPTFRYDLSTQSGKTIVKQTFVMPTSIFEKVMMGAFGVVDEISDTNKLGLERLKKYVEAKSVNS